MPSVVFRRVRDEGFIAASPPTRFLEEPTSGFTAWLKPGPDTRGEIDAENNA